MSTAPAIPSDTTSPILSSKTPPPSYSMTNTTAYSPDHIKGAEIQPDTTGESLISQYQPSPAVNDGGLPEVVTPAVEASLASASRSSLRYSNSPLHDELTVTPLHLLADQSDMVDCPFCRRRVETRVLKEPSVATQ